MRHEAKDTHLGYPEGFCEPDHFIELKIVSAERDKMKLHTETSLNAVLHGLNRCRKGAETRN